MKKSLILIFFIFLILVTAFVASLSKSQESVEIPKLTEFTPKTLTIEEIFSTERAWLNTLSDSRKRTIIATGDVITARSVNYQALVRKDFKWPFLKTADFIKSADITFINLETPLLNKCLVTQEGMSFCGDAGNVEGLVLAGVDVANLANNHAGNYGEDGVEETKEVLMKNGIDVTGVEKNNLLVKDVRGLKFAFLGYNDITKFQPGVANAQEERIKKEILEARKQADVVIVAYHWGAEYRSQPDDSQIYLGHLAIDAGADLVIGNHPHWIQPIEFYKGRLITYAHGNYIFDQMWSEKTKEGVIGKYTFYDNKLVDVEYFPLKIQDYGQAYFLEGGYRERILTEMKTESLKLKKTLEEGVK